MRPLLCGQVVVGDQADHHPLVPALASPFQVQEDIVVAANEDILPGNGRVSNRRIDAILGASDLAR